MSEPVINQVLREQGQDHSTRKRLFTKLGKHLRRPVVSFFTSFYYPVAIEDADANMIEGVLRGLDLTVEIQRPDSSGKWSVSGSLIAKPKPQA